MDMFRWRFTDIYHFMYVKIIQLGRVVVPHSFNLQHLGGRGRQITEFEASLLYTVSSRTVCRNPVSNQKTKPKQKPNVKVIVD